MWSTPLQLQPHLLLAVQYTLWSLDSGVCACERSRLCMRNDVLGLHGVKMTVTFNMLLVKISRPPMKLEVHHHDKRTLLN